MICGNQAIISSMSDKKHVIAMALRLSETERIEVAEALYQSLQEPPDPHAEQAWSDEIRRRIDTLDAGGARLVPWEHARRQIAGDTDGAASD
jgi:putative addiction module component (TIGR02574 family)